LPSPPPSRPLTPADLVASLWPVGFFVFCCGRNKRRQPVTKASLSLYVGQKKSKSILLQWVGNTLGDGGCL